MTWIPCDSYKFYKSYKSYKIYTNYTNYRDLQAVGDCLGHDAEGVGLIIGI